MGWRHGIGRSSESLRADALRKVMEGMDTLEAINGQFCDDNGRPYRDLRILHTYVLDDPFDDPPQVKLPQVYY